MKKLIQKPVLFLALLICTSAFSQTTAKSELYACLPCGRDCDKADYNKPGQCQHCQMALVKKSTVVFKTIEPGKICAYIASHPRVVLLDVRTKEEFDGKAEPNFGSLKNAINIPIQELEGRAAELNKFKNKEIIVYCSHSHRSPQASYLLTQKGFTDITNMAGGMSVMEDNSCKK